MIGHYIPDLFYVCKGDKCLKKLEGRDATQPQVRRILDGYAQNGFVESNQSGFYRITELARKKFGLAEPSVFDALNENGAPLGAPDADEVTASSE